MIEDSPSYHTRSAEKNKRQSYSLFGDSNSYMFNKICNRIPTRLNASTLKMWQRVAGCYAAFSVHEQKKENSATKYALASKLYDTGCKAIVNKFKHLNILPRELTQDYLKKDIFDPKNTDTISSSSIWRTLFENSKTEITNVILVL